MKNQDQLKENPLHIYIDVMEDIRKHYSVNDYSYIKTLTTYINNSNEIVLDNIPVDAANLYTLLGISKHSAAVLINKLVLHDIMLTCIKRIDNRVVQIMILSPYIVHTTNPSISTIFKDIRSGLKPLPAKIKLTI
jgi:hypothetical protein